MVIREHVGEETGGLTSFRSGEAVLGGSAEGSTG